MIAAGRWNYPNTIRFGAGCISGLPQACIEATITRPLLVTDRGLAGMKITQRALGILDAAGFKSALFADVDPNPNEINLAAGVAAFHAGDHDGVVAFGGGPGLDLGKMVAFMAGQTRPIWDFEDVDDWWTRADAEAIAPIVAVPTTAGTGSEVGRASVITDTLTHAEKIIFHPKVLPAIVLADPELTVGMPRHITAGTGLDAFAHCVEAFSSPHYHPMSQGIALEGMRLVIENLPRVFDNPDDIDARMHIMSAAMMGAVGFQKGLGAIHALSHPVGAMFGTHHGTTNAVCMPAVLDLNESAIRERFNRAAFYLGTDGGYNGFRDFVEAFNNRFAVPERLRDIGADPSRIDALVIQALADPSCGGNPVALSETNVRALFERVL